MTNTAPDLTPGYPSKGTKLGPAWNEAWTELKRAQRRNDPYVDGRTLADNIAPKHDLSPATLVAVLQRAARNGLLVRESRRVAINLLGDENRPSVRTRTHYKVAA